MRGNSDSDRNNTISTYQNLCIPIYPISDRLKSYYHYRYSFASVSQVRSSWTYFTKYGQILDASSARCNENKEDSIRYREDYYLLQCGTEILYFVFILDT